MWQCHEKRWGRMLMVTRRGGGKSENVDVCWHGGEGGGGLRSFLCWRIFWTTPKGGLYQVNSGMHIFEAPFDINSKQEQRNSHRSITTSFYTLLFLKQIFFQLGWEPCNFFFEKNIQKNRVPLPFLPFLLIAGHPFFLKY